MKFRDIKKACDNVAEKVGLTKGYTSPNYPHDLPPILQNLAQLCWVYEIPEDADTQDIRGLLKTIYTAGRMNLE